MLPRMNPKICGHVDDERSEAVSVNLKIAKTRKSKFICLIRFMKKVESWPGCFWIYFSSSANLATDTSELTSSWRTNVATESFAKQLWLLSSNLPKTNNKRWWWLRKRLGQSKGGSIRGPLLSLVIQSAAPSYPQLYQIHTHLLYFIKYIHIFLYFIKYIHIYFYLPPIISNTYTFSYIYPQLYQIHTHSFIFSVTRRSRKRYWGWTFLAHLL